VGNAAISIDYRCRIGERLRSRLKAGGTPRSWRISRRSTATGGYFGALSIPSGSREAPLYRDAVAAAQAATPKRPSIVNGQIAAALSGEPGDRGLTRRISRPTIFVNPLMAIYFTVDLIALAA
jgi:hypothetical protein